MNKFIVWNLFATILLIVSLIIDIPFAIDHDNLVIFVRGFTDGALFITVFMTLIYYIVKK